MLYVVRLYHYIARAYYDRHPTGEEIEVYIISSTNGCHEIRQRAQHISYLKDRIDRILIDLSPLKGYPNDIGLTQLPRLFYEKYHMKIINNDGGHQLMLKCYQANIMSQFNLTLCRKDSLKDIMLNYLKTTPDANFNMLNFNEKYVDLFFQTQSQTISLITYNSTTNTNNNNSNSSNNSNSVNDSNNSNSNHNNPNNNNNNNIDTATAAIGKVTGGIPLNFIPCQIIVDNDDTVAVITFNTHNVTTF